jgi:hypothetical protein
MVQDHRRGDGGREHHRIAQGENDLFDIDPHERTPFVESISPLA